MTITLTPDIPVPARSFVPDDFDPADAAALQALVDALVARPIGSAGDLRRYVHDWSEIESPVRAQWARRKTALNRNTGDEERKAHAQAYQNDVLPVWERHADRINRVYLASPWREQLGTELEVFDRNRRRAAEIFRVENTPLAAEDRRLAGEWQEIQGATVVELDGRRYTPSQIGLLMLDRDAAVRERAMRAQAERRARDRDRIDALFDEMVRVRTRMARNAGFDNYRDFRFAQMNRFDYTPEDCVRFHAAVEAEALPAASELHAARRARLGLATTRPSDLEVSLFPPREREKLFDSEEEFIELGRRFFRSIDPLFEGDFDVLVRNGLLDLMSRPNKAPGAYNWGIQDMRLPFVFANAVGRTADLRTLLHEGGHAFHTLAARGQAVLEYRGAPPEFSEVASMAMEMFGLERMPSLFDAGLARETAFEQLQKIAFSFGSVATVDAFQHWIYVNPDHTPDERRAEWVRLNERFSPEIDWSGLEELRGDVWQRVPHFFSHPFYFIEYGIAQLGALQMWRNERRDHDAAIAGYRRALALGGSRPIRELYEAAGLRFAMDRGIFAELVPELMGRLRALLA